MGYETDPDIIKRFEAARKELLLRSDVVSVSLGYKETGKDLTDRLAVRVYVKKKKKSQDVPAAEIIPAMINGLVTDVIEAFGTAELSKGGTRPLLGGLVISTYDGIRALGLEIGTLGCIAKRRSSSQHVILSNQHVIESDSTPPTPETGDHRVRQPSRKDSSGFYYENHVGPIVYGFKDDFTFNGNEYYVDAAIANINSDEDWTNKVEEIGVINGSESIIAGTPPNYTVRKKGMTTSLTHGVVVETNHDSTNTFFDPALLTMVTKTDHNVILVRPAAPFKELTATHEVAPADKQGIIDEFAANEPFVTVTANGNRLTFTTKTFMQSGDSGSVLVNSPAKVVGLLYATSVREIFVMVNGVRDKVSINTGRGIACNINPVLEKMDITIESGAVHSAGELLAMDEAILERAEMQPGLQQAISRAEPEIAATRKGKRLIEIFKHHAEELVRLIHHYRPVKLIWHRNKGPAFSASLINALRDPCEKFSKEVNGISINSAARNLRVALEQYAGVELKRSLEENGDFILDLLEKCSGYTDIIHFLKQHDHVPTKTINPE